MAKNVHVNLPNGIRDALDREAERAGRSPESMVETALLRWAGLDDFGSARQAPSLPVAPMTIRVRADVMTRLARAAQDAGVGVGEAVALILGEAA